MPRESGELRIGTRAGEDLGIARSDHAALLALEGPRDDRSTAASGFQVDDLVEEVDELVGKTNSYLLAHTNMVAKWYAAWDRRMPVRVGRHEAIGSGAVSPGYSP